jgi:uncharacterized phage-associated protein
LYIAINKRGGIMAIKFNMNKQKAIECILWIIQRGESNMYNIWKILFSAEKYHLNNYGRPITGDDYIAMKHGTVPSWLYEEAKNNNLRGIVKGGNTLYAERLPITKLFSESDEIALEHGYNEYAGLDFDAVEAKNHKEPAWEKNWKKRGMLKSVPIPFEDLITEGWLLEDLKSTPTMAMVL